MQPHLIYVADPMCSWCWGFVPVIGAMRQRFGGGLPIRLVLGGLRPGTTEPLDEPSKRTIREHWEHVREASGQPFDFAFFDRTSFVYDTEPASRAVVVARRGGPDAALSGLEAVQRAFYAENRDVTDTKVLADIAAAALGLDKDEFLTAFASEEAQRETWTDFAVAQRAGIRGFPTLLAGAAAGEPYGIVTQGFQPAERILAIVEHWREGLGHRAGPEPGTVP